MSDHDLAAAKAYAHSAHEPGIVPAYLAGLAAGRAQDRRERIAAWLMASATGWQWDAALARESIKGADALLAELDRTAAKPE
jgi:hypothetical protein